MEIINKNIEELKFAKYNPRQMTEKQANDLENSIKEFGIVDPIIINKNPARENIIVGGHMRARIAKKLGIKEVPCVYVDLDIEKEKELNIRLNKNLGEWDWDKLANFDIEFLKNLGFEDEDLGIDDIDINEDAPYSNKIKAPTYKITGEKPKIEELYDTDRTKELEDKINKADLNEEEKEFLLAASKRFIKFNYGKIAEHYAHSSKEIQELMEDLTLIIIDYNKAIDQGYIKLSDEIRKQYIEEYGTE